MESFDPVVTMGNPEGLVDVPKRNRAIQVEQDHLWPKVARRALIGGIFAVTGSVAVVDHASAAVKQGTVVAGKPPMSGAVPFGYVCLYTAPNGDVWYALGNKHDVEIARSAGYDVVGGRLIDGANDDANYVLKSAAQPAPVAPAVVIPAPVAPVPVPTTIAPVAPSVVAPAPVPTVVPHVKHKTTSAAAKRKTAIVHAQRAAAKAKAEEEDRARAKARAALVARVKRHEAEIHAEQVAEEKKAHAQAAAKQRALKVAGAERREKVKRAELVKKTRYQKTAPTPINAVTSGPQPNNIQPIHPISSKAHVSVPPQYLPYIKDAAETISQNSELSVKRLRGYVAAQIEAESHYDPDINSDAGAQGIVQLMPFVSGPMNVNPYDPAQAIAALGQIMAQNCAWAEVHYPGASPEVQYEIALAGYNAGMGSVEQYDGIPPFAQTIAYVKIISNMAERYATAVEHNE